MKKNLLIIPLLLTLVACTNDSPDLTGVFTVGKNKQIQFSPGLLQYRASTNTWRFAGSQLEFIGENNAKISSTYNGWIDLFGYGCSGYDDKYPWQISNKREDYAPTGDNGISGTEYDWGIHCQIENGGPKGSWHLMDSEDWYYLFEKRENAENLATIAQIGDMIGLLIFPDGWENTTNLSVQFYNRTDTWGVYADSITIANNTYSKSQWRKLEKTGAVFLAYMGNREDGVFQIRHTLGFFYPSDYWCGNALYAGAMCWVLDMNPYGRKGRNYYGMDILFKEMSKPARGCYVRLVKDVQTN